MNELINQNSCQYAEELVSYLYDEIGAKEKLRFESHIDNCASCAAELADFSMVRSSIVEWRETEFLPLSVPAIQLPVEKVQFIPEVSDSRSLLAQIRAFLSLSPAWTGAAAAAALVICVGLILVALNFQREPDMARVENNAKTETVNSPTTKSPAELQTAISDDDKNAVSKESSKPPIIETKEIKPKSEIAPVKVLQPAKVKLKKIEIEKSVKPVMKKSNQSPPPTLLADEDESEDDSLRLSDLFEEVGS